MVLAGCAALRGLFPPDRPFYVPPEAERVSGPHARAITAAYSDFLADQAREREDWGRTEPEDGGDGGDILPLHLRALNECLDRPESFQFWVYLDDAGVRYVVDIDPKPEFCLGPKGELAGGGAIYEIDARTFEILKKEIQE